MKPLMVSILKINGRMLFGWWSVEQCTVAQFIVFERWQPESAWTLNCALMKFQHAGWPDSQTLLCWCPAWRTSSRWGRTFGRLRSPWCEDHAAETNGPTLVQIPCQDTIASIAEAPPQPLNSYGPSFSRAVGDDDEALGNTGLGNGIPTSEERSSSSRARLKDTSSHAPWAEMTEEFYVLEFDIELPTAKQKQRLMGNPSLFLASKLRDCEVRLEKLKPELRELFRRAELKEVNSFFFQQSSSSLRECPWRTRSSWFWSSYALPLLMRPYLRLWMKWPKSLMTAPSHWMASVRPRQELFYLALSILTFCQIITRLQVRFKRCWQEFLSYQLVLQASWEIEGWDLSPAFLQTLPSEESKKLWTTGVQELREALNLPPNAILRILKNLYGSTTAPRNLWKNTDGSLKTLGAVQIVGNPRWWIWRVPFTPQDQ